MCESDFERAVHNLDRAMYAEDRLKEATTLISLEERKPIVDGTYLTYYCVAYGVGPLRVEYDIWFARDWKDGKFQGAGAKLVTHWQELPNKPEGKKCLER